MHLFGAAIWLGFDLAYPLTIRGRASADSAADLRFLRDSQGR